MSYATYENSLELGAPVELYEFIQGTAVWRFASSENDVTATFLYTASPIKRDRIKQTNDTFKGGLRLTFPRGDSFASQFIGFAPDAVTTVTIWRGHAGDPSAEFTAYWKGRVVGAVASENEVSIDCESVFTSVKRPGLRAKFEYGCRHSLYSAGCGISQESFKLVGAVESGSTSTVIKVTGADAYADGYFLGGMLITSDNAARSIVAHTGVNVTLARPYAVIPHGTVALHPGCDHLKGTCETKFSNLDNFGGFPWIPVRNPFDGSSII